MNHFDHVVCAQSNVSGHAEVYGEIDVGQHLSPFRIALRRGHEREDMDTMLAYLVNNRTKILAGLMEQRPAVKLPQLVNTLPQLVNTLPQMANALPQMVNANPLGLPFA